MIFMTGWTVLRLVEDNIWLVQKNYNRCFIKRLWIWFQGLKETFVKEKVLNLPKDAYG